VATELKERLAAVGVEPYVLTVSFALAGTTGVSIIGDRPARKVEGMALAVGDNLYQVRVVGVVVGAEGSGQGRQVGLGVILKQTGDAVQVMGIDFGFVALEVDNDIGVELGGDLGNAIGAARMIWACHANRGVEFAAGTDDTVVIGGDKHLLGQTGLTGLFVHVLKEVFSGLSSEKFSGETRRSVTSGNYDYNTHVTILSGLTIPSRTVFIEADSISTGEQSQRHFASRPNTNRLIREGMV